MVSKVWLPYYICPSVEETLRRNGSFSIGYYHIDESLRPVGVTPREGEYLLWVNYFGLQSRETIRRMTDRFPRLIVDNTQAFFSEPVGDAYYVYSCRKFFGVTDGAYAVYPGAGPDWRGRAECLSRDHSARRASQLLISLEEGANAAYALNKACEEGLAGAGIRRMSPLTEAILSGIDYHDVKERRVKNQKRLHGLLGARNLLSNSLLAALDAGKEPLYAYPFACARGDALRAFLVAHKVWVPKLWKETAQNENASATERRLADEICPLPVDQRYDEEDMTAIARLVECFLSSPT